MSNNKNQQSVLSLEETLSKEESFFLKYRKAIIIGVVAVVAIVAGVILFHGGDDEIHGALAQLDEQGVKGDVLDLELGAHLGGDGFGHGDIDAHDLVLAVLQNMELKGRIIRGGAQSDGLFSVVGGLAAAGAQSQQHGGGHENGGQLDEFLHKKSLFSSV